MRAREQRERAREARGERQEARERARETERQRERNAGRKCYRPRPARLTGSALPILVAPVARLLAGLERYQHGLLQRKQCERREREGRAGRKHHGTVRRALRTAHVRGGLPLAPESASEMGVCLPRLPRAAARIDSQGLCLLQAINCPTTAA